MRCGCPGYFDWRHSPHAALSDYSGLRHLLIDSHLCGHSRLLPLRLLVAPSPRAVLPSLRVACLMRFYARLVLCGRFMPFVSDLLGWGVVTSCAALCYRRSPLSWPCSRRHPLTSGLSRSSRVQVWTSPLLAGHSSDFAARTSLYAVTAAFLLPPSPVGPLPAPCVLPGSCHTRYAAAPWRCCLRPPLPRC